MSDKIPPHNEIKKIFKASLIFFIFISVLAVSYEAFKSDIDPLLNKYLPGSVEFLAMSAKEHQDTMGKLSTSKVE